ncbi:hypothetical protein [Ruania zhangjianzhongii]|uniref:hypothetical protein n=1 Tax=Ruania zhangjianzhongii TaxID=2603206 RepID=UPI0011CAD31B|nr:hypothetical protein [Ruania zhangjianzhongii]
MTIIMNRMTTGHGADERRGALERSQRTKRRGAAWSRITTAVAITAGLFMLPAAAATAAPSADSESGATASDSETASSWKYEDWYFFKSGCQDAGQNLVDNPYLDYEDYQCVPVGDWPFDGYHLYMKS